MRMEFRNEIFFWGKRQIPDACVYDSSSRLCVARESVSSFSAVAGVLKRSMFTSITVDLPLQIKQNFELKYFLSDSENGFKIQIWVALILNLLFTVPHKRIKGDEDFFHHGNGGCKKLMFLCQSRKVLGQHGDLLQCGLSQLRHGIENSNYLKA